MYIWLKFRFVLPITVLLNSHMTVVRVICAFTDHMYADFISPTSIMRVYAFFTLCIIILIDLAALYGYLLLVGKWDYYTCTRKTLMVGIKSTSFQGFGDHMWKCTTSFSDNILMCCLTVLSHTMARCPFYGVLFRLRHHVNDIKPDTPPSHTIMHDTANQSCPFALTTWCQANQQKRPFLTLKEHLHRHSTARA